MNSQFINKILAQPSFEKQLDISLRVMWDMLLDMESDYSLTSAEQRRLDRLDREVGIDIARSIYLNRFENHCRELYGSRWIGNDKKGLLRNFRN